MDNEIIIRLRIPEEEKEVELEVFEDRIIIGLEAKISNIKKGRLIEEEQYEGFYDKIELPVKIVPEKTNAFFKGEMLEIHTIKREEESGKEKKKGLKIKVKRENI